MCSSDVPNKTKVQFIKSSIWNGFIVSAERKDFWTCQLNIANVCCCNRLRWLLVGDDFGPKREED